MTVYAARTLTGIARALGGEVHAGGYLMCPGPGHSLRDRSLKVWIDDGGSVRVQPYAADAWQDCRDYVLRVLGEPDWRDRDAPVPWSPPARKVDQDKADRDARFIRDTLAGCRPLAGTPIEVYLRWRRCGLPTADDAVLFHPGLRHPTGTMVPAMVARITSATDAATVTGLHLTALTPTGDGKADMQPRKWMRGRVAGGVVRLVDDAEVVQGLGIAEGIETALAVMASGWSPVWAALSAGNMASLPPLSPLSLTAFADRDPAGMTAAGKIVDRWRAAGLEAATAAPPAGDWADGGDYAQS